MTTSEAGCLNLENTGKFLFLLKLFCLAAPEKKSF